MFAPKTPGVNPRPAAIEGDTHALNNAVEDMQIVEDVQSIKEEAFDEGSLEKLAEDEHLLPLSNVISGCIEIDSSSGSDSDSSSSHSDSSEREVAVERPRAPVAFSEDVPGDKDFYKHVKSMIVHSCALNSKISACKLTMNENYKLLDRRLHTKLPKCLRCFPKDNNRIRSLEGLTEALDMSLKRSRKP